MKTLRTLHITLLIFCVNHLSAQIPQLNSYPSASATVYLDFDGEYVTGTVWNWGGPIDAAAPNLTSTEINEIFNRVAEDFKIFNLNITTSLSVYQAAPIDQRVRVIVTPSSSWYGNAGGVSYVGSFTWGDDTPAWVFTDKLGNNIKYIAEACSHETGHTLGLQHQSTYDGNCAKTAEYAAGQGSGEIGWAPIMGVGYYKNLTTWFNGTNSINCNTYQNDIDIIAGSPNNFGFRPDDFADTYSSASNITINGSNFAVTGLVNSSTDKDVFRFTLNIASNFKLAAVPENVGSGNSGANIDIRVSLLNSIGDTIGRYNPSDLLNAGLDTNLVAGNYYLIAEGVGNVNLSDYGSLGVYTLTGSINITLPVHDLKLKGTVNNNIHSLTWSYSSDEPVKEIQLLVSNDGTSFENLATLAADARSFSYQNIASQRMYYRVKAITVKHEIAYYSNIISLDANQKGKAVEVLNTLVNSKVMVNSTGMYSYELMEANGRTIAKGKLSIGANTIDANKGSQGLLLLRISTADGQITTKLIKQ